jgi:hypothetical protein
MAILSGHDARAFPMSDDPLSEDYDLPPEAPEEGTDGLGFDARSPERVGDSAAMRALLPVGRSWWAIAAGYLGLGAIVLYPAPLALLTGLLAVVDIRRHPERHGMGRAVFGILMGAVGSVLLLLWLNR